ncbi:MAG TPA: hypothetical protein VL284_01895 [Thermoanaerobaculia bacterium]|nr:hypothetical protein [Thermoanaerobaculia bacterium]
MRRSLLVVFLATVAPLFAQTADHRHDFDYLLGDWQFTGENQQFGKFGGFWSAVRLDDGDIFDEYRVTGEKGETYYVTRTLRSYNARTNEWELVSTGDGAGLGDRGTGHREGNDVRIEQTFGAGTAHPSILRIRYYDIEPDRFSWIADRSVDGGKTWTSGFQRIEAKRLAAPREFVLAAPKIAATPATASAELAKLKARVMSADYRADFDELARVRDELAGWPNDRDGAYLAHYWKGYASWRIAINGASHSMKGEDLAKNLKSAAADFYASIRLNVDFADAYAAVTMVNSWLGTFSMSDPAALRERISLSQALLARAAALDPKNPRMLWARGAFLLYPPASKTAEAIDTYKEMLAEAERRGEDPSSPLPDWGKPEALMSIAYASLALSPPDLATAREDAQAALKLRPEWSYVRDTLLPDIESRSRPQPK